MDNNSQMMAEFIEQTDISEMYGKYLTFWTDKQLFGIPIMHVEQIVGMQTITQVPEFPHYAKGIINLRGSIIPVMDARLRLGKGEGEYDERTCIIVTNIAKHHVGIIVEYVEAVVAIADELIVPPPKLPDACEGFISGVGKLEENVVLLMDVYKILGSEELGVLTNSGGDSGR